MADRLFAYGSLMFPEVFARVSGRRNRGRPSELAGFGRYCLRGRSYPGIVRQAGSRVPGILYDRISRMQWRRLDAFEGREYRRVRVRVRDARGWPVPAWTYVVPARHRSLLGRRPWNPRAFSRLHLRRLLVGET